MVPCQCLCKFIIRLVRDSHLTKFRIPHKNHLVIINDARVRANRLKIFIVSDGEQQVYIHFLLHVNSV